MVGLNWLMGSQHSPLNNWISDGNTYKHNKRKKKKAQICFHSKRQHTTFVSPKIMIDNKNMDTTISKPVYSVKPVVKGTSISQITVYKRAVSFFPLMNSA